MSIIRKLLNIVLIALIAIALPVRSNPPFNPDDPKYPPLLVKWSDKCLTSNGDGWQPPNPPFVEGSEIGKNLNYIDLENVTDQANPKDLCQFSIDFNKDGGGDKRWGRPKLYCKHYFTKVKESMVSPCQYIVAYGVSVNAPEDNEEKPRLDNYLNHHLKDGYTPPASVCIRPAKDGGGNACENGVMIDDAGVLPQGVNNKVNCADEGALKIVQFRLEYEPNCEMYEEDNCPDCTKHRVPGSSNDPVQDADSVKNNNIISQGCMPEISGAPWKSIGVGGGGGTPDIDLGGAFKKLTDSLGNPVSGIINMLLPTCLVEPTLPATPFNKFDKDWQVDLDAETQGTQNDIKSKIDAVYGDDGTAGKRTNEWRGNCGRGVFFYNHNVTIGGVSAKYRNSNLIMANPPRSSDDAETSEIWESRTGCYNPEERFVHLPPYADFKTEKEALDAIPGDLGTDRIKFFEPTRGGRQFVTGSLRDGAPDEPEAGSGDSAYFIPNDRLLMEHPLCTARIFSNTLQTGLLDDLNIPGIDALLDPYVTIDEYAYKTPNGVPLSPAVIKNMMATQTDIKEGVKTGALPMCMAEDVSDDADDYCLEYLKFLDEFRTNSLGGVKTELDKVGLGNIVDDVVDAGEDVINIGRERKGKYNAERYYFNYDKFCWEPKERPFILPPDPYERWMPLAIRSFTNPTSSDPAKGYDSTQWEARNNFLGDDVSYTKTDIRRPTFTPYAERHTYDYTEFGEPKADPGNLTFLNLSLEEYGYGDVPHMRTDYNIDPTNIYQITPKPSQADLLLEEKRGRKYKLQQCLRMYLEQWAFEGDRGAILLSDLEAGTGNKSNLASDVSMCQWVASYDTSQNYEERDKFREVMTYFFGAAFTKGGTNDVKAGSLAAIKLGGKMPVDLGIPGFPNLGIDSFIKKDDKFKHGMRPEYFDYMNFLTASVLPAELEENNLTNKVEVDGGEHFYDDLYNRLDLRDPKKTKGNDVPSFLSNPQRINFAKRDCETVVPPQFWRDSINPFYEDTTSAHTGDGCHPIYDFKNITNILWTFDNRNPIIGNNPLVQPFIGIIEDVVKNVAKLTEGNLHWLTTREDMPLLSLATVVPSLPTFAIGIAPKNKDPNDYDSDNGDGGDGDGGDGGDGNDGGDCDNPPDVIGDIDISDITNCLKDIVGIVDIIKKAIAGANQIINGSKTIIESLNKIQDYIQELKDLEKEIEAHNTKYDHLTPKPGQIGWVPPPDDPNYQQIPNLDEFKNIFDQGKFLANLKDNLLSFILGPNGLNGLMSQISKDLKDIQGKKNVKTILQTIKNSTIKFVQNQIELIKQSYNLSKNLVIDALGLLEDINLGGFTAEKNQTINNIIAEMDKIAEVANVNPQPNDPNALAIGVEKLEGAIDEMIQKVEDEGVCDSDDSGDDDGGDNGDGDEGQPGDGECDWGGEDGGGSGSSSISGNNGGSSGGAGALIPYVAKNWEKFPVGPVGGNPNENFEIRDVWIARAGGKAVLNHHIIQDQNKAWTLSFPGSKLGMIVVDEKAPIKGREWVDHSFPARSCMHMEPLPIGTLSGYWNYVPSSNNTGFDDYNPDPSLSSAPNPQNLILDAWKNWDDIKLYELATYLRNTTIVQPPLATITPAFTASNEVKNFGGFKVKKSNDRYYKWLPTPWSVGLGMGKAFWCEFEVPYFPYFIKDDEFQHAKKPFAGHFKINAQGSFFNASNSSGGGVLSFPLEKNYKPRLEYYRVERIRDACGPFGVASTWVDDPNAYIADWLIGKPYTYKGTQYGDKLKLKSRCADWFDSYRRKTNDPKIIAWRLPRFDYEFLKSFLECTGPIKSPQEAPPVCEVNGAAKKNNEDACQCEIAKGLINTVLFIATLWGYNGNPVECVTASVTNGKIDEFKNCDLAFPPCNEGDKDKPDASPTCKEYWSAKCNSWREVGGGEVVDGLKDVAQCIGRWCDYTSNDVGKTASLRQLLLSNTVRAIDYCTRGDTEYAYDHDDVELAKTDDRYLYGLKGFDNNTMYYGRDGSGITHNSVDTEKFWLKGEKNYSGDDAFGFWCKCPKDKLETTRCREDFCTCQQHVLMVGRDFGGEVSNDGSYNGDIDGNIGGKLDKLGGAGNGGGFLNNLKKLGQPVAICKWYGPYLRWLQCFYQARAKACPVVTREVSDTENYDSVYDPFRGNKKNKIPNLPEVTQKSVVFNTCDADNPQGNDPLDTKIPGNNSPNPILDYLRWSKEEPNHLARLPVWFESAGAGYKHQDFVFQAQTRRWESPFMELAVPFPIDLITRNCTNNIQGTGICNDTWQSVNVAKDDPDQQGESINNLKEIHDRGGLGYKDLKYNSGTTFKKDEYQENELNGSKSVLLLKEDNSIIRPMGETLKNQNYTYLYKRYIEGLYAAHLGFRHGEKPEEPWSPTDMAGTPYAAGTTISATQNIHPRAQDAVVGPRGCDIGGWYEMMLYQARCIKWWKLNCICDYDKTFAIGNSETYVHKRAGATFNVAVPSFENVKYKMRIAENRGLSYSSFAKSQRNLQGVSEDEENISLLKEAEKDATGKPVFSSDSEESPTVKIRSITIPLAYRGIASPEFAGATGVATDNIFYGLSDVMVGDILVWNESINYTLADGSKIDAGHPRHSAYVESVRRDSTGRTLAIGVSEMNWGKNIDSCGNTNRWGRETKRTIVKPMCASSIDPDDCPYKASVGKDSNLLNSLLPQGVSLSPNAGTINLFADCKNADWAVCVEKYWDQVMVYRPYTFNVTQGQNNTPASVNVVPDPNYMAANCPANYPRIYNSTYYNEQVEPIFSEAGVALPTDVSSLKVDNVYDYTKVSDYIIGLYRGKEITRQQMEKGLWKLLIDPAKAVVAIDELEETMLDALNAGGAVGRCDPPIEFRTNYESVKEDYWTKNDNE